MNNRIFFIGLLSAMAASCSVNEITIPEENGSLHQYPNVIHAVIADQPGDVNTKVFTGEDLYVRWNADDHINYFDKYSLGYEYCFAGEEGNTFGDFEKVDDGNPGEGGDELDMVYAIYPFRKETAIDDKGVISYILPDEQYYPWENSFGRDANTMVSSTETEDLKFKNVGGYLSFKLYGEGVNVYSITLKGNNGELLSGKCTINSSSGEPIVTMDSEEASNKITLICDGVDLDPESSKYMEFWMVIPPTTFSKGITFRVETTDGGIWSKSTSASFSIGRNVKKSVPVMEVKPEIPENIVFADALVEEICVKYWDENEDGGLSYDEAAAVKTLMVDEALTKADGEVSAFAGTDITSFDELEYFTGLTEINAGAFEGCDELTSVTIPENVEAIGDNAFNECSSLESIRLTSSTPPPIVGSNAFAGTNDCPIYVPAGAVDEYVSAGGWSIYADRIEAKIVSFRVPLICNAYEKTIDVKSLAEALGVNKSKYQSDYTYKGMFAKDGDSFYEVSDLDLCGTAGMTNAGFKWSIDPHQMENTETIYLKYSCSQSEFFLQVDAEKCSAASFDFGTNRLMSEWYNDIDSEPYNTARIAVCVPNHSSDDDVTEFYRDLDRFFIMYQPAMGLNEDSDPVYNEFIGSDEMATSYTYNFAQDQPRINGIQLVVGEDNRSLYAGSVSEENLLAYFDGESNLLFYNWAGGETVAKEFLNKWSSKETDQSKMLYANILVNMTYGDCRIPAGNAVFHVRFLRPLEREFEYLLVDTLGTKERFYKIVDWNKVAVIRAMPQIEAVVNGNGTITYVPVRDKDGNSLYYSGRYEDNIMSSINMREYYGISSYSSSMVKYAWGTIYF